MGPRWTWDPNFPKPAGKKDMGDWTASVYTREQQRELGVNEWGQSITKEERTAEREARMMGPRWTWDPNFPKPAGKKDMGGMVMRVYTKAQQEELGVNEWGQSVIPGTRSVRTE